MIALLALLLAPAHAFDLSNDCDAAITAADRAGMEAAEAWLEDRYTDVRGHVKRVRGDGNPFNYGVFSSGAYDRWENDIDKLLDGRITVRCHYSTGPCEGTTTLLGRTVTVPVLDSVIDGIHVCMNNLRNQSDPGEEAFTAALAGTLSHEAMHHADGFEAHGEGGTTDPANPDANAEVVGSAVEHMMLVAELDAGVSVASVVTSGADHLVDVTASLRNDNRLSASGIDPLSGFDQNDDTEACVLVDGSEVQRWTQAEIDGGSSDTSALTLTIPAFTAGQPTHEIAVLADCDEVQFEQDEDDNRATVTHSTWVDLHTDLVLAAAPVRRTAFTMSGAEAWYEVTFEATVTNLDSDTPSPAADLTWWTTDGGRSVSTVTPLPALAPGATHSATLTVDVPTTMFGSAPVGTTMVRVVADDRADQTHDRDRANNSARIDVDADWWRPNYRIAEVRFTSNTSVPPFWVPGAFMTSVNPVGLELVVENVGPVDGDTTSALTVYSASGSGLGSYLVPAIASMGTSASYRAVLEGGVCGEQRYTVLADSGDVIAESDEDDNGASLVLGDDCPDLSMPEFIGFERGIVDDLLYGTLVWEGPEMDVRWQVEQLREWLRWVIDLGSPGPFLPVDWQTSWVHTYAATDTGWLFVSLPHAGQLELVDTAEMQTEIHAVNGALLGMRAMQR